jgi:anti-sigma B factor antagonist
VNADLTENEPGVGFAVRVAERPGGGSVATVLGELDVASAPELRSALEPALDADGEVELDMRACSFVDSIGIATLVMAARRLSDEGRTLRIRGARERVRKIFDLAGLTAHSGVVFEPEDSAAV